MGELELGLFTAALGLSAPWRVTRTEFDGAQLDLYLDFPRGARFACPAKDCAEGACVVHDTVDKTWRHMDFFQYKAFLHARLPRVRCPGHGVRQVSVSWARPGSGFTMLFEALVLTFAKVMPVAKVAELTREHDSLELRTATAWPVAATSTQLALSLLCLLFRQWAVLRPGAGIPRLLSSACTAPRSPSARSSSAAIWAISSIVAASARAASRIVPSATR